MNIENEIELFLIGFTPVGILFLILASILVLFLPRRHLTIPIFLAACYMTFGQVVYIFDLDFRLIRILLLIYWIRLFIKGELILFKFDMNIIDKFFLCWIISAIITYTILYGTTNAFINRLGLAYDAIGTYFLFRYLINDLNYINNIIKQLSIIITPLAILMVYESFTGRNLFSFLGGVGEIHLTRGGMIRCTGPFRAPHLAGTLGATLMPLFLSTWFNPKIKRLICLTGFVSATIITVISVSTGPIIAYGAAIIWLMVFKFRKHIRIIKWGMVFLLFSLHLIMKAPIWYLMARLGSLLGGEGWHRSYLIEQFFNHFSEWWLIGAKNIRHWMPYGHPIDPDKIDVTNQYIVQAVNGGLVTMFLFIAIIIYCFKAMGRVINENNMQPIYIKITLWSIGASLFAHVINFLSVSYFDQINVFWYLLLAMISSLHGNSKKVIPLR